MRAIFASIWFLLYFVLVFSAELCPPPEQIQPCKCISGYKPVTYKCSNVYDQETMEGAFRRSMDWPLNAVICDSSSLQYISTPLINSKNVTTVAIYHSRFVSLFTSPPNDTNKIENIILRNTTFTRGLDWRLFQNLSPNIIQIQEVTLKRISNTFVENLRPSVTRLTLEKGKIQTLHNEAFAKLTSLRSLSCGYNSIKAIKRSMFPPTTSLQLIDFGHNKLELLPDDMFSNMPELSVVYFNDNRLQTFTSTVWEGIFEQMQAIYLDDNPIICDCKVKWYTTKSRSVRVRGKCETPEHMKGWNLIQLSEGDFHYCQE